MTCELAGRISQNTMTKQTRTDLQVYSAIAMLVAGVGLSIAGFVVPPTGEISDSVLMFTAQCLVYAGSALGINVYINSKFSDIKRQLTHNQNDNDDANEHGNAG